MKNTTNMTDHESRIHALSLAAGALFAEMYADPTSSIGTVDALLESYKSLRRALPRDLSTGRHIGSPEAYKATQGKMKEASTPFDPFDKTAEEWTANISI